MALGCEPRNQVKPIGAEWLCNGTTCSSNSTTEMHGAPREKDDANQDPQNPPIITEMNRQGEIIGITNLKARYYPLESFLTEKLGNNPSYIWRSMFEAQNFLSSWRWPVFIYQGYSLVARRL